MSICNGAGCSRCPANDNCSTSIYRGSACAALRYEYGADYDPDTDTNTEAKKMTRFEQIKNCQTPEEMCVVLNANERKFCPYAYSRKPGICQGPCGRCITQWLKEEIQK